MITVDGLTVEFGGTTLFKDISFQINEKDRIALMGKNGAGKSTLLKIIAGVRTATRGSVSAPKDCVIAYLPQHLMTEDGRTVFEETCQAFAHLHQIQAEIDRINNELLTRTDYDSDEYMQLIENVRRYKGVADTPVFGRLPVPDGAAVGCFCESDAVYDSFDDGDFARHAEGSGCVYDNRTQRNAIRKIKVKHDGEYLCFLLRTKQPVTPYDGTGSWMRLYLNTTGGQGYQFVLNTHPAPDGTTTLARVTGTDDDLTAADLPDVAAFYEVDGDKFKIKVPLRALGLDPDGFTVWFKAADSREPIASVEDFYDKGDVAPLGRMNFVYRGK